MYQNNASFFVRQFQNNMLRKQAGLPAVIPGQGVRTLLEIVNPGRVAHQPWYKQLGRMGQKAARYAAAHPKLTAAAAGTAGLAAAGGVAYGALSPEEQKARIKQLLYAYAPYVGGGAAIGALLGGGIGYANDNTLLGTLGGTIAGAGLGGTAKYLYDRYKAQA